MCDQRIINDKVDAVYLLSLLRFVHCEPEGPWSDGLLLPPDVVAVLTQTSIFIALYEILSGGLLSEEVGESAGAHVGSRRVRVPYIRRMIYVFGGSRLF